MPRFCGDVLARTTGDLEAVSRGTARVAGGRAPPRCAPHAERRVRQLALKNSRKRGPRSSEVGGTRTHPFAPRSIRGVPLPQRRGGGPPSAGARLPCLSSCQRMRRHLKVTPAVRVMYFVSPDNSLHSLRISFPPIPPLPTLFLRFFALTSLACSGAVRCGKHALQQSSCRGAPGRAP